jgi:hypothetical protein
MIVSDPMQIVAVRAGNASTHRIGRHRWETTQGKRQQQARARGMNTGHHASGFAVECRETALRGESAIFDQFIGVADQCGRRPLK